MKDITLLCKVVDNFGDIGFVYRLSRAISELNDGNNFTLRLVVSNLEAFNTMAEKINPELAMQEFNGWKILDWNKSEVCRNEYLKNPPEIILECFQCGRPDWLEEILFQKNSSKTVNIINVEYLTAESWADDFHLLKSGTRSKFVKKINFMPGFTNKTGGLVLDNDFISCIKNESENSKNKNALEKIKKYFLPEQFNYFLDKNIFTVLMFSYDKNFDFEILALKKFQSERQKENLQFKIKIFSPSGMSYNSVLKSLKNTGCNIELVQLKKMEQTSWDALLCSTDFNFIRGEDSFSRACLSGVPFLWHAYIQEEEFQIVKVDALLKRMEYNFLPEDFKLIEKLFLIFNRNFEKKCGMEAENALLEAGVENEVSSEKNENLLFNVLVNYENFLISYRKFARELLHNGNLAENLIKYISTI